MIDAANLHPIDGDPCIMWARIDDMHKPIRRIFPLWLLHQVLRLKQMKLAAPRLWDDPFEDPASLGVMDGFKIGRPGQQPLEAYLARAWAQCWSMNPGSDTLLRAYSRVSIDTISSRNIDVKHEGVTVTTTPHRLIQAMKSWHQNGQRGHFVLAAALYLPEKKLGEQIYGIVNSAAGPKHFQTVQGRADSLLWKRDFFRHEEEVRLLNIIPGDDAPTDNLRTLPIEPNELFEEISFDPRLIAFERTEREAEVRRLGFEGRVAQDLSYMGVLFQIPMMRDWEGP